MHVNGTHELLKHVAFTDENGNLRCCILNGGHQHLHESPLENPPIAYEQVDATYGLAMKHILI